MIDAKEGLFYGKSEKEAERFIREKDRKKTRSKTYSNNEIYTESRARTDFTTSAGTQVAWMDKQGGRSTIKDNS